MAQFANEQTRDVMKLAELIRGIGVCMLTTAAPDGSLHSRPMVPQAEDFRGELWFFSEAESAKVKDIGQSGHVSIEYVDPEAQRYVAVTGAARVVRDPVKAKEVWRPAHQAWFGKGPDDPKLVMLKVEVQEAEYWDVPSGRMVQLSGLPQSGAAVRQYTPGERGRVEVEEFAREFPPHGEDVPKSEGTNYARDTRGETRPPDRP